MFEGPRVNVRRVDDSADRTFEVIALVGRDARATIFRIHDVASPYAEPTMHVIAPTFLRAITVGVAEENDMTMRHQCDIHCTFLRSTPLQTRTTP